jgi:hypothetical protein
LEKITMNQEQLAQQLLAVSAVVAKIGQETKATLDKVQALQASLDASGTVSPEVQAALDGLLAQVQAVDALVPDAPVPMPAPVVLDITPTPAPAVEPVVEAQPVVVDAAPAVEAAPAEAPAVEADPSTPTA